MYTATTATRKIAALRKRIRAVAGGTSASKTVSILLVLIQMAQTDKVPKLTSIVSESLPHLKLGAMRDFLQILKEHKYFREERWNRTDFIYTFETGSRIEFFGADAPAKAHGPRRDRLYINEANNVPYASFDQMEVRTKGLVFLDWNPTNEFWFYTDVLPNRGEDTDFITLTYRDNEALPPAIVKSIESRKENRQWWRVYGEGQLGESEGRIYTGWRVVDEIPHEARLVVRWLDFGYSNDPTAIGDVYYHDGGYILDEHLYQKGLSNKQIADFIHNLEDDKVLIKADSAEPKSIDELKSYGLSVLPAEKGPDSVRQGIQRVQQERVSVTKRSVNLLKEYRNYLWETDRDGRTLNVPADMFNHHLDGVRYAFERIGSGLVDRTEFRTYGGGDSVTGYGKSATFRTFAKR